MIYEIAKPKSEKIGSFNLESPGLKIELTNDKSLIEFYNFYYGDTINDEDTITQIVGVKPDEIDKVIGVLKDIKSKLEGV